MINTIKNIQHTILFLFVVVGLLFAGHAYANNAEGPYFPIKIQNKSNIDDSETYLFIKAQDPATQKDCYMVFDDSGHATCQVVDDDFSSMNSSKKLSSLPHDADNNITLYLPHVASGRIYFSYHYPMDLPLDKKTNKIIDADGFKPRDSNYYTLYDKVEFTFTENGTWMNPTAVDFFSLPIHVEQKGTGSEFEESGFTDSRQSIMNALKDKIAVDTDNRQDITDEWMKLFLTPNNQPDVTLRFMAPGKAMIKGIPNTDPFDDQYYIDQYKYGNGSGYSYVDDIWNYYKDHDLKIDVSELKDYHSGDVFTGRVNADDEFVFTGPKGETVTFPKQTTSLAFFAGATGDFDAPNNTPKAIIAREFTSAATVGLLGSKMDGKDNVLKKTYFVANKANFYTNKAKGTDTPWYDVYSKVLHSFEGQPIYTYAYDDALGQDGTLHSPTTPDNPTPKTATIILGDMAGVQFSNALDNDTADYTITTIIPNVLGEVKYCNGSDDACLNDSSWKQMSSNQDYSNIHSPLHLMVQGKKIKLYLRDPLVRPYVDGSDGIMVKPTNKNSKTALTIEFPASLNAVGSEVKK